MFARGAVKRVLAAAHSPSGVAGAVTIAATRLIIERCAHAFLWWGSISAVIALKATPALALTSVAIAATAAAALRGI